MKREAHDIDPVAVLDAHVGIQYASRLTGSTHQRGLGNADHRPPVPRAGSTDAQQWPSRRGDRLYYTDGRVTLLDGTPVVPTETAPRCAGRLSRKARGA